MVRKLKTWFVTGITPEGRKINMGAIQEYNKRKATTTIKNQFGIKKVRLVSNR